MIIDGYRQFGGVYSETAAVRNVLAHMGVAAPHSGLPFTEAMLFGISGGIGFSYFTFEYEGVAPSLYLGVANRYKNKYGTHMDGLYQRLGIRAEVQQTGSPKVADKNLKSALDEGKPVIVHVDRDKLPFQNGSMDHAIVAFGYDDEAQRVVFADRCARPLCVPYDVLAEARGAFRAFKHRSTTLSVSETMADIGPAIEEGIRACVTSMREPPSPKNNFGLAGLRKWVVRVSDRMDEKGWPQVFSPGAHLYAALYGTFSWIELIETGGGALRELYANFLEEAAGVLDKPALRSAADAYWEAARGWREAARAALPSGVPLFREARELAQERECVFLEHGEAAAHDLQSIDRRLAEIESEVGSDFPLGEDESLVLLDELRVRVARLVAEEEWALQAVETAL
jgi:hypothetical protein